MRTNISYLRLILVLALFNRLGEWNARRKGDLPPRPLNLDCRHCTLCPNGK